MLKITSIAILSLLISVNASADFEEPGFFSYLLKVVSVEVIN